MDAGNCTGKYFYSRARAEGSLLRARELVRRGVLVCENGNELPEPSEIIRVCVGSFSKKGTHSAAIVVAVGGMLLLPRLSDS